MVKARAQQWDQVLTPLSCYRFGPKAESDPRVNVEYKAMVQKPLGLDVCDGMEHLGAADVKAIKEVVNRKAAAFWVNTTPAQRLERSSMMWPRRAHQCEVIRSVLRAMIADS